MATDIANFIQREGRIEPFNVLANAQKLQLLRGRNEIQRGNIDQTNALREALRGGDIDQIGQFSPGAAEQTRATNESQQQEAANYLRFIIEGSMGSTNPRAFFEANRNGQQAREASERLDMPLDQLATLDNPDEFLQELQVVRDGLLQFTGRNQLNKPTKDIQNFLFGQTNEGFNENQLALRRAGATNIQNTVGGAELPKGFMIDPNDPGRAIPIPGTPAELTRSEKLKDLSAKQSATITDADAALTNIDSLLKNKGKLVDDIYGSITGRTPTVSQSSINAEALRDQITGLLTLENRQKLKGQGTITDVEVGQLERSASLLGNPLIGPELAKTELNRVRSIFANAKKRAEDGNFVSGAANSLSGKGNPPLQGAIWDENGSRWVIRNKEGQWYEIRQ